KGWVFPVRFQNKGEQFLQRLFANLRVSLNHLVESHGLRKPEVEKLFSFRRRTFRKGKAMKNGAAAYSKQVNVREVLQLFSRWNLRAEPVQNSHRWRFDTINRGKVVSGHVEHGQFGVAHTHANSFTDFPPR